MVTAWQHILQIAIVAVITTYAETSLMASSFLVLEVSSDESKSPYAKIARTSFSRPVHFVWFGQDLAETSPDQTWLSLNAIHLHLTL